MIILKIKYPMVQIKYWHFNVDMPNQMVALNPSHLKAMTFFFSLLKKLKIGYSFVLGHNGCWHDHGRNFSVIETLNHLKDVWGALSGQEILFQLCFCLIS